MEQLNEIIIQRLEAKGMDITLLPSFIRDVANTCISREYDLKELNRRLGMLGWEEFELDDHTLRLIEAVIERECFISKIETKSGFISNEFLISQLFQKAPSYALL